MSDMTIEQLQADNEALKAKNAELLDELKKARQSRTADTLREQVEALEADKKALQAELKEVKTKDAWETMYTAADINPRMAKFFRSELEEAGLSIDLDDDGEPVIVDDEGRPVPEIEVLKNGVERDTGQLIRPTNPSQIGKLVEPIRERFPEIWPVPRGSGAPGSNGTYPRPKAPEKPEDKQPQPTTQFGIR